MTKIELLKYAMIVTGSMVFLRQLLWLFLFVVLLGYCSSGANTPEEAFERARKAYLDKNARKFVSLLTEDSIAGIESSIEPIRTAYLRMADQKQAQKAFEPMAKKIGVPVSRLGSLTVEEYIAISMGIDDSEGRGSDTSFFPKEILEKPEITRKEEQDNRATLYFGEIHKMNLRKTDKGWKIVLDFTPPDPTAYPQSFENP